LPISSSAQPSRSNCSALLQLRRFSFLPFPPLCSPWLNDRLNDNARQRPSIFERTQCVLGAFLETQNMRGDAAFKRRTELLGGLAHLGCNVLEAALFEQHCNLCLSLQARHKLLGGVGFVQQLDHRAWVLERREGILLVCWQFANLCELSSSGRQYDFAFDRAGARLGFLNRRLRQTRASSHGERESSQILGLQAERRAQVNDVGCADDATT